MRITHSLVPRRKSLARLTAGGLFIINGLGPIKEASLRILNHTSYEAETVCANFHPSAHPLRIPIDSRKITLEMIQLLEFLDIKGCIITAENCKKDYGGKRRLCAHSERKPAAFSECPKAYFENVLQNPQYYSEINRCETIENGHGRIEKRTYSLSAKETT